MDSLNSHSSQVIVIIENIDQLEFSLLEFLFDDRSHVSQAPAETDVEGRRIVEGGEVVLPQTLVHTVRHLLQLLRPGRRLQSHKRPRSVVVGVDLQLLQGEMERPELLHLGLETVYEGLDPVVSQAHHPTQAQMVMVNRLQVKLLQDKVFSLV